MHPVVTRTPEQIIALRQRAIQNDLPEDIYENFTTFAHYMIPTWTAKKLDWIWVHYYICECFQMVFNGELDYLTIETPPQIGKTALTTLFIVYCFGSNPDIAQMYFTYNEVRATSVTKENIFAYMGDEKFKKVFPFVILKNDINKSDHSSKTSMKKKQATLADNKFNLINPFDEANENYRGKYAAFGLGQGAQGNPADIMTLDDYVGKGQNIKSENFRDALKGAFYDDIISRFQPYSKFIIVCTRWYEEDPIGQLHSVMQDIEAEYARLNLPAPKMKSVKIRAEYREHDDNPPCDPRTKNGDWLWDHLISKFIAAKRSPNYNAMYNCDPSDVDQQKQITREDFGYYSPEDLPAHGRIFISIDGASTIGKESDHTAIGAWMVSGRRRFLLKLWYVRLEVPKLMRYVEDIITEEFSNYNTVLIEYANSGVPIYQYLSKELRLKGIVPLAFNGRAINDNKKVVKSRKDITNRGNSKLERYLRMIPEFQVKDKRILLPIEPIEHQETLINQLTTFSGIRSDKDDLVDMTSYLVNYTSNTVLLASKPNTTSSYSSQNNRMNYFNDNPNFFIRRDN